MFCQANSLFIGNVFSAQPKIDCTNGHHWLGNAKIKLALCSAGKNEEALFSQPKHDLGLIIAQFINSFWQNITKEIK